MIVLLDFEEKLVFKNNFVVQSHIIQVHILFNVMFTLPLCYKCRDESHYDVDALTPQNAHLIICLFDSSQFHYACELFFWVYV